MLKLRLIPYFICQHTVSFLYALQCIFHCVRTWCVAWEQHGLLDMAPVTKGGGSLWRVNWTCDLLWRHNKNMEVLLPVKLFILHFLIVWFTKNKNHLFTPHLNLYDLPSFVKHKIRYFDKCLSGVLLSILWKCLFKILQNICFYLPHTVRKKFIQVWNDMRVSKLSQN